MASGSIRLLCSMLILHSMLPFGSTFMKHSRPKGPIKNMKDPSTLCPTYPSPTVPLSVADLQKSIDAVSGNIEKALHSGPGPAYGGVSVGLVYDQKLLWSKGFGNINDSDPAAGPPTVHTGFRIASITKVFTDLMMYQLRDGGQLASLDDDVRKCNSRFSILDPFGATRRGVTFRQLSSHTSGLPRNPPCPGLFISGCSATYDEVYRNIATLRLLTPPGARPAYSNLGIGLLGRSLEPLTSPLTAWEDYVVREILGPLGMEDSGTRMPPDPPSGMAVGYDAEGRVTKYLDIGWDAPAGNMYSSVQDLAQLLKMIFRTNEAFNPSKGQVLDGETIREWMKPAYVYHNGYGYGHPWELLPFGNYTLVTKGGRINGYLSEIRFAPEIKAGVIVLQNWDKEDVHDEVSKYATELIAAVSETLWSKQTPPPLPPQPQNYVGNYTCKESGTKTTVAYDAVQKVLIMTISGHTGRLSYVGKEGGSPTFQLLEYPTSPECETLSTGYDGMWVYFREDPVSGFIAAYQIPGMEFGAEYTKMI